MSFEIMEELNPKYLLSRINDIISADILSQITSNPDKLLFELLPQAVENILSAIKAQLVRLFEFHEIPDHGAYNQFVNESKYRDIITNYVSGISDHIKILPGYLTVPNMKSYLKSIAVEESNKLKRSLIAENIIAGNWSRAEHYKMVDPQNINIYKWAVFFDNRTSIQCKEIYRSQGEGLPLEDLKILISEVANAHEPKYSWRDWDPHFYCRSRLIRVFE